MAEKISMLIIVVDLDCRKCYHKIRKILCQLQDCEMIRTISFDNKSKTITIVGPFDPLRLACKLRCKGGKVVRDVHIVDTNGGGGGKPPPQNMPDGPPPTPALRNGKIKNKKKATFAERPRSPPPPEPAPGSPPPETMSAMPPPSPVHHPPAPPMKERQPPILMPACPARPLEQQPVAEYVTPTVEIPSLPAPPVGPCGCLCCAPCYQGYYESCRCCCCGRMCSSTTVRLLPAPCRGYRGCRTFSGDDPSAACTIM